MGIFFNKVSAGPISPRAELLRKYELGRSNLLLAIVLTAINIFAPLFGADFYFMFSIFTPTTLNSMGLFWCGMYPEEVYAEAGYEGIILLDQTYYYIFLAVAVIITLVFLVCWFLSKGNKVGWLIAATVLFTIDSILIFVWGASLDYVLDIIFHAWVLYSLISGIVAHYKLKALPAEDEAGSGEAVENEFDNSYGFDTSDNGSGSDDQVYDSVLDAFNNPDPKNRR